MKALMCLTVAHLCLSAALGAETRAPGGEWQDMAVETACAYPSTLVLVSAPGGKRVDADNCDAEYEKAEWQQMPKIMYPDADPNKSYTLVNVDPDPPAYESGQYFLHWLVSNIKGEDFAKGDLSKAKHLQDYYGPAPPAGSGMHRYMFLALEEEKEGQEVEGPGRRGKFELAPWLQRQKGLRGPVAGIQFRTKF